MNLQIKNDPNGSRTRVAAVKGRCPRPLDDGVIYSNCFGALLYSFFRPCQDNSYFHRNFNTIIGLKTQIFLLLSNFPNQILIFSLKLFSKLRKINYLFYTSQRTKIFNRIKKDKFMYIIVIKGI